MENNIENKTSYFLKYRNQTVFCNPMLGKEPWDYSWENFAEVDLLDYMLLKSLKSITVEDAIKVAEICFEGMFTKARFKTVDNIGNTHEDILSVEIETYFNHPDVMGWLTYGHLQIDTVDYDLNFIRKGALDWNDDVIDTQAILKATDFLISQSYYVGEGKEIEFGWAKLREAQ